jgi:hypothetical protein
MNLPEDHMDELFRKAGEMYPLKTDGADWDKVMTRLQKVSDSGATTFVGASGRKWWLLTLLIVPFALICNKYIAHQGSAVTNAAQTAILKTAAGTPAAVPQAASALPKSASPQDAPSTAGVSAMPAVAPSSTVRAIGVTPSRTSGQIAAGNIQRPANLRSAAFRQDAAPGELAGNAAANSSPSNNQTDAESAAASAQETNTFDLAQSLASGDLVMLEKPRDAARSSQKLEEAPEKGASAHKPPVPHFYAGVLVGPDVSTIKYQNLSKPGYSVGIILGYRFNKRLAVEVSALWDRKNYYTSSEYFNKAKAGIPSTVSLGNMNGVCEMFEIPISLRWDFFHTKTGNFYATGGLSSYMMKNESYSYEATNYGTSWAVVDKQYMNSGNNFFSMLHLSVGYTLQWKGVGDLRIEPYFKIPLSGVGIGSLPITSSGLYLGLTHSFR